MGRAPCCDKANVKKGPWSPEEDAKLKAYIEEHGTGGNWIALPHKIGLKRCGKSCRLRWLNYLRPNIKHGGFSEEEDQIICSLYISIGSRWSIIAAQLPGRTDNDIKNYWNTRLKKKLLGRCRQPLQSRRISGNQDPKAEAASMSHDSPSQALSASAVERMQLHMQLQGFCNPFSFYSNPLLWPKIHPLGDNVLQGQHIDAIATTSVQQASSITTTEPSDQAMLPMNPNIFSSFTVTTQGDFENSNLGSGLKQYNSNFSSMAAGLQAEPHDQLYGKSGCSVMLDGNQLNEFDCFNDANGDRHSMNNWWSTNGVEERSSPSSWDLRSAFQPDSMLQEYVLGYEYSMADALS